MHDVHDVVSSVGDLNEGAVTHTSTSDESETDDDYSLCSSSTSTDTDSSIFELVRLSTPPPLDQGTPLSTLFMTPPNRTSTPLYSSDGEGVSGDISMHSLESPDSTELNVSMISPTNESTLSVVDSGTSCPAMHSEVVPQSVNAGIKIVFDNIDKTCKPRHMTLESQTTSLHYVQAIAVKDRIDYSFLSDTSDPERESNLYGILPDADDYDSLKKRFIVHVSRIIVAHLRFFKADFKGLVPAHIPHRYSSIMSMKSEVVSTLAKEVHKYTILLL